MPRSGCFSCWGWPFCWLTPLPPAGRCDSYRRPSPMAAFTWRRLNGYRRMPRRISFRQLRIAARLPCNHRRLEAMRNRSARNLVLHLVSLAAGLAAFVGIARKQLAMGTTPIAFAVLLTLASVPCFELTGTIASETVFFALSMCCMALLSPNRRVHHRGGGGLRGGDCCSHDWPRWFPPFSGRLYLIHL